MPRIAVQDTPTLNQNVGITYRLTQRHPTPAGRTHPRDLCFLGSSSRSSSSQRSCQHERLGSPWIWFITHHHLLSRAVPCPARTQGERSCHFRAHHSRAALPHNSGVGAGADRVHAQGLERDSQTELRKGSGTRRSPESRAGEKG